MSEKKEIDIDIMDKPGNKIQVQKIMLSELSIKIFKEQDKEKKAALIRELEALSMATNSIIQCRDQLNKLHKLHID